MNDERMLRPDEAAKGLRDGPSAGQLPTGYSIDHLGTLSRGELAFILARSGCSKSTWYMNVVANTPQIPTVVFNMEMLPKQQMAWLAAMAMNLPVHSSVIERCVRDPEDEQAEEVWNAVTVDLLDKFPTLMLSPILLRPTLAKLDTKVQEASDALGTPIERVFIDHLELLEGASEYGEMKKLTDALHAWALDRKLGVYVVQQTTRSGAAFKNDGHLPVTISSGVYTGEAAADFMYGLYRPVRDPALAGNPTRLERLRYITRLQLIKNRPTGELNDEGIELEYVPYSRKLVEVTENME